MTHSVFVVYQGRGDIQIPGTVFPELQYAEDFFDWQVNEGLTDSNRGLFIVRVDNLTDAGEEELRDNLFDAIDSHFENYDAERVKALEVTMADWSEESLTVGSDDFANSDEDYLVG